jgi:hypothetical protein
MPLQSYLLLPTLLLIFLWWLIAERVFSCLLKLLFIYITNVITSIVVHNWVAGDDVAVLVYHQ